MWSGFARAVKGKVTPPHQVKGSKRCRTLFNQIQIYSAHRRHKFNCENLTHYRAEESVAHTNWGHMGKEYPGILRICGGLVTKEPQPEPGKAQSELRLMHI